MIKLLALICLIPLTSFAQITSQDANEIIAMGAEGFRTCFLKKDKVDCLGANGYGEGQYMEGLVNARQLAMGAGHTCALDDLGVSCWGLNTNGQTDVPFLENPTQLTARYSRSCAIDQNKLVCWGYPEQKETITFQNPKQLVMGISHACALDGDQVRCWGDNRLGQTRVPKNLRNVIKLAAGRDHTCALFKNGAFNDVKCWGGAASSSELDIPNVFQPTDIFASGPYTCIQNTQGIRCGGKSYNKELEVPEHTKDFRLFTVGFKHSCGIDQNSLQCAGIDLYDVSSQIEPLEKDVQLLSMGRHGCGQDKNGFKCWANAGLGGTEVPKDIRFVDEVAVEQTSTCVIIDKKIRCWGSASPPQGLKNPHHISAENGTYCVAHDEGVDCWGHFRNQGLFPPKKLKNIQSFQQVYVHACAIVKTTAGEQNKTRVECWNGKENAPEPTPNLKNPTQIAVGSQHACAIDDNGVQCWGDNSKGQLNVPTHLKNPRLIASTSHHTCVLDDERTHCWGYNAYGQTSVPKLGKVRGFALYTLFSCAITDEGVRCWGRNEASRNFPRRLFSKPIHY